MKAPEIESKCTSKSEELAKLCLHGRILLVDINFGSRHCMSASLCTENALITVHGSAETDFVLY
jgi:hypothetical protein